MGRALGTCTKLPLARPQINEVRLQETRPDTSYFDVFGVFGERRLRCPSFKVMLTLMLPDEQLSAEQIRIFRAMPGERRLQLAERLYWSARKIKSAGLRMQHPEWPENQIKEEVRRIFLHART